MLTTEHYPQAVFLALPVLIELEGLEVMKITARKTVDQQL